ncbi:MAG: UDP-N-acetylmuramoyl-tripeptide--D-alanyl-D-alanine ligase [Oscillospiraceae bacterium]
METVYLSQLLGSSEEVKEDCLVSSIVVDSRLAKKNSIFLAVKGERVNGENYAKAAIEKGACFVLTENEIEDIPKEMQRTVPNILDASIQLGANFRTLFDIETIGVTGSVGKTSTKDFIYAALSPFAKTVKSTGNQNNEIGMPQTIFTFTKEDRYAILEMGMADFNDVHKLSMAAKPKYAVITCIGNSHLERMKTQENILKAKLEICDGVPRDGVLVLNGEDKLLAKARVENPAKVVYFATENRSADVVARDIVQKERCTEFKIVDIMHGVLPCTIPTVGLHNVKNALAAYTVVTRMGFDAKKTAENLNNFIPSGMRQKIVENNGIVFIEDCYNANPESMRAAINTLVSMKKTRAIGVLGDMLELGQDSNVMHYEIGEYAKNRGVDLLFCFGQQARHICDGFGEGAIYFDSKAALARLLKQTVKKNDVVIFKASRGMAFEEIIEKTYEL